MALLDGLRWHCQRIAYLRDRKIVTEFMSNLKLAKGVLVISGIALIH